MTSLSHGASLTGSSAVDNDLNIVEGAIDTLYNGVRSFETASAESDNPALAALMNELGTSRKNVYDEVVLAAAAAGRTVPDDEPGTLGGALQRGWMQVRGALVGDDAILDAALSGEGDALTELSRAIDEDLPGELEEALRRAMLDVDTAIKRLQGLNAS